MAALNIEEIDKILEEPMSDYDFYNEWDDENVDPDFQIDSDHNTDSEADCKPSESPHNDNSIIVRKGKSMNVDRMTTDYSVARNTNRWQLTMFFYILNISSINGGIIHNANKKSNMTIRVYIKNLSLSLVKESLVQRAHNKYLLILLRQSAKRLSGTKESTQLPTKGKRVRCHYCKSDSKTQYYCENCRNL